MKIFHLADLHIGKIVDGVSMLDEARHALKQVVQYAEEEKPDAILLAGDLYDRRNPPLEALEVFDRFLVTICLEMHIPVLAIGGNHDGGVRLNYGTQFLSKAGFYLAGAFSWPIQKVVLQDAFGAVDFYLLPYVDLAQLRHHVPEVQGMDYSQAMAYIMAQLDLSSDRRSVLMAHGVVFGEREDLEYSDSERLLSIGGTEYWSASSLKDFSYVALGHLHRPQRAGAEHIRYAGSLCKYSFSEENHQKGVTMVEIGKKNVQISFLPIAPLHDMKTVRGTLDDILQQAKHAPWKNDYLRIVLTDEGEVMAPMAKIQALCPRALVLEREQFFVKRDPIQRSFQQKPAQDPLELFAAFYQLVHDDKVDPEIHKTFAQWLKEAKEKEECDHSI